MSLTSISSPLRQFFACAIAYVLLASLLTAPGAGAVESAPVGSKGASAAAIQAPAPGVAPHRAGEVIVRFREGISEARKGGVAAARGMRRKGGLRGESRAELVELEGGQDATAAAAELRRDPAVELAEPNYLVRHNQVTPDDTRFREQWALKNEGQSGGAPGSDLGATAAWQETTGAGTTVVAVVDGGVDFSHPDLRNNRWTNRAEVRGNGLDDDGDGLADDLYGWNWVYDTNDVGDEQGHGTSVAGIIAAEGGNRAGIAGVMWHASLMSLKVLDSTGTGDVASAVEAIDYAVAHGAAVVNCSWGTEAESSLLKEAVERAGRRGVIVVTSAGNAGRDIDSPPYYPASYDLPNLIAVASSDGFDRLAQFSNWGAARVAVAAPGTDILTTQLGGDYHYVSGTSASAPAVAGIAGLVKTVSPNATAAAVRSAITGGARRVDALAGKVSSGGVADAAGALAALRGNPYSGNGGVNSGGVDGQGNSNGQGGGQPYVPPALRRDNEHGRANGRRGLDEPPPATVKGAPDANLPDLTESRKQRSSPSPSVLSAPIQANLMCADCDPAGGGGGGQSDPGDPFFGTERTRPGNGTGDPGVNLGSRNFNWSMPLVSLPGRAGLDLSLALYYNSLVWTKQGTAVQYNPDHGTPAPGFQLGLPRLQARYFNAASGAYSYIMITPSGGRVEMRQVGSSGVYESADATYTQVTFENSAPVVRTTDGTQYVFGTQVGAEWRCTQIKDRNGNYITAEYDPNNGHLLRVKDTLWSAASTNDRVVSFNYNADGTLGSISQNWGGASHTYATFVYGSQPMSPTFSGVTAVYGVPAGGNQTVLSSVTLADNASYHFDYNSYGQVYQIRHKAPDGHELEHTRYNLSNTDLSGAAQTDCPRFTARYDYAQDWNGGAEAVTAYAKYEGVSWQNPETLQTETGTFVQQTTADGTTYKEYFHATGWDAGLPRLEEVWATENQTQVRKKWTSTTWAQDDQSLPYPQNPRLTETNVYDGMNRRRTTVDYGQGYGLPTLVREWGGADGLTLLRKTATDYNLDPGYVGRRIIGLPLRRQVYDGAGALASKVEYYYDWGGDDMFRDTPAPATQHDRTNYGPALVFGRGNLSNVARFDVNDPGNLAGGAVETKFRYNVTGSVLMQRDHLWHSKNFDYADSFSDGVNRNTFAYATTVTNENFYSSTVQYNYDHGAVTRTHSPTSGTGAGITYLDVATGYDSSGRPERVERFLGQTPQGYQRVVYDPSYNHVHTYETVAGLTQADEFHSWQVFDGAGRVRAAASDHPGSAGGYSGQHFVYDSVGRLIKQSNPTEITGGWVPAGWALAGDDVEWVYTEQVPDWKGRPTKVKNPDGTTQVFSYGGCGCAGGEVTTVQDEHGRQKRYTKDTLGRLKTVEELTWGGGVYSTTQYAYNALDQIREVNQQGQLRTFEYDGHGRLWRRTTPEQGATTYAYNPDDTVYSATDARGAKAVYGYSYRHEVTSVTYDLSGVAAGQNVAAAPNVSFGYDAAGNRTSMTERDGANSVVGSTTYHYDALSRMDWEERYFPGAGTYRLSYEYNPAGELEKLTYPAQFGSVSVSYGYDKAGRLSGVTGAGYAGVSTYASSITYRAFGAVKGMSYADGRALSTAYDKRMRPTKWDVPGVLGYKYYYDDFNEHTGRVTYAQHITGLDPTLGRAQTSSPLDRSYEYDHVGRLAIAHSGAEAKAHAVNGQWGTTDGPYSQGYDYDVWGNMTHRYGWGGEVQGGSPAASTDRYYSYANGNNRRTDPGFAYDNAGNLTFDGGQHFTYDAAGRQTYVDYTNLQQGYDGDGLRVKKSDESTSTVYYLRSSALGGQVIAEIKDFGGVWGWNRGYVYAGSQLLAVQYNSSVNVVHEDPVTKSKRVVRTDGLVQSEVETDPYGADTGLSVSTAFQPRKFTTYGRDYNGSDEAMFRRYNRWHSRFDQPDPYEGSYDPTDPQSFNRYAYVQGDPVNFIDPTGLDGITTTWMPPTPAQLCLLFGICGPSLNGGANGGGTHTPLLDAGSEGRGGSGPQKPRPTPTPRPEKGPCDVKPGDRLFGHFFSPSNLALFRSVAEQLNTDMSFVMTHSAWESHYGDTHARDLHNLFGLTHGGGSNLNLSTYKEGADIYVNLLKDTAANGAQTFDDYVSGLKQAGYNFKTKDYYDKVKGMLNDVMRHYRECLATL